MATWNSWYNPLDNIANVAKGAASTLSGGMYGGVSSSSSPASSTYNATNNSAQDSYNQGFNVQPTSSVQNMGDQSLFSNGTTEGSPNPNSTSWIGGSGTGSGGGGSAPAAPSYDPNELRMLDQQRSDYERLLQSAESTLGSGLTSIKNSYDRSFGRYDTDRTNAEGNLTYQRGETERGKEKSLNTVGDNSRMLRNSLMRLLGQASGGGSAFNMADMATAREATKNRSGVLENYGSNIRGLDLADRDTKTEYDRMLEDLELEKKAREQSLRTGITTQQQTIQGQLAQLMADRARVMGGDQFAAADPYRQQYLSSQDKLDALPGQFATEFKYNPAEVKQPTLKDYSVSGAGIGGQAPGRQTQYSPYSNFLQKKEDEQRLA